MNKRVTYSIAVGVQICAAVGWFTIFWGLLLIPIAAIIIYIVFKLTDIRHMWHCLWTNTLVLFISTLVLFEIQSPKYHPDGPNLNSAAIILARFPLIAMIYNIPMIIASILYFCNRKP